MTKNQYISQTAPVQNLRVPAIELQQGPNRKLYSFAIDGKLLGSFTSLSRLRRHDSATSVLGYQRPEVISHIGEIRSYLESSNPIIPNALVIAFDSSVEFVHTGDGTPASASPSRVGELHIPIPNSPEVDKPGWIVDGQQRSAAIREANIRSFPVFVTAFVAADEAEQREQFILVNSTKPLPKSLLYELIPDTYSRLPKLLQKRRIPARILQELQRDPKSPFYRHIKTPTNPGGIIQDTSVLKMIEHSLTDGALYTLGGAASYEGKTADFLTLLYSFWGAVAEVFDEPWKLPPRRSRLTHGAGIVSLGFLMDAMLESHHRRLTEPSKRFVSDLAGLAQWCKWTEGNWDFGPGQQRKWNDIQNTSHDIRLLSNYLLLRYRKTSLV